MDVITCNVGQGSLSIVRSSSEAIIIDSNIPPSGKDTVAYVKGIFSKYLAGYFVRGLIITGFDMDHADATGVGLVLRKYRPDWIMYPKYYKDTEEASAVFAIIEEEEKNRANTTSPLRRISVRVDKVESRQLSNLSSVFGFELFSPHIEDMDSSNNSSIVVRITGSGNGSFSYLVTGDTEYDRWETISRLFGSYLKSAVLAAPHHGSKNGVHPKALLSISPNTVLISAGVDNQYGHPDSQAVQAYSRVASQVYSTNVKGGVSLLTTLQENGLFKTNLF